MIKIKKLNSKDIKPVLKLFSETMDYLADRYYPRELTSLYKREYDERTVLKRLVNNNKRIALGVFENKKLMGFAWGFETAKGLFFLDWIAVDRGFMGKRLGEKLIRRLEAEVRKRKFHKIYFNTYVKNTPAVKLYLKTGYKIEGILRNHFDQGDFFIIGKNVKTKRWNKKFSKVPEFKTALKN